MRAEFAPHLEILPPAQRRILPRLHAAAGLGFALYGGTAVALRLGHRSSVDFDFFSERALDRAAIRGAFEFVAGATVLQDHGHTLTLLVDEGGNAPAPVKLSFFGKIDFGRVGVPGFVEEGGLLVASLDDLMASKLKVVLQRAEAKDYRDIAAMLNAGVDLARGLPRRAPCSAGPSFQPSESLKALVYFDDGDLRSLSGPEKSRLVAAASAVRDLPVVAIVDRRLASADDQPGG